MTNHELKQLCSELRSAVTELEQGRYGTPEKDDVQLGTFEDDLSDILANPDYNTLYEDSEDEEEDDFDEDDEDDEEEGY